MPIDVTREKDEWRQASGLTDLGALTASWIEGTLSYHPCQDGGIDDETSEISNHLVRFNRLGFVTTFSQPAEVEQEGFAQRACVEGFAKEALAKRLAALSLYTPLLVFVAPIGYSGGYQVPITIEDYRPFTWCGSYDYELEGYEDCLSREALDSLSASWKIVIIDLEWGRKELLWEAVERVLLDQDDKRFSVKPADDGLGCDFVY